MKSGSMHAPLWLKLAFFPLAAALDVVGWQILRGSLIDAIVLIILTVICAVFVVVK